MLPFGFWHRVRQWFTGPLVLFVAVVTALFWSDNLLQITKKGMEIVIRTDELAEVIPDTCPDVERREREEPPSEPSETQKPHTDTQRAERRVTDSASDEGPDVPADRPKEEGGEGVEQTVEPVSAEVPPTASETRDSEAAPPSQPLQSPLAEEDAGASPAQVGDRGPGSPPAATAAPAHMGASVTGTTGDLPVVEPGGEGGLASFSGYGLSSDGTSSSETGHGAGPVWDIHFTARPSLEKLRRVEGTVLAAVRQRRGYTELAVLGERSLGGITTVDDFVAEHPGYRARQGILLPREWLAEYGDKLIKYGGGWQLWLLAEDDLFLRWHAEATTFVARQGHEWPEVGRISAVVKLGSGDGGLAAEIGFRSVEPRRAVRQAFQPDLVGPSE